MINQSINGLEVITTTASTKTLTVNSIPKIQFTGTTAGQVVQMPDVATLSLSQTPFECINDSTQSITYNSSGGNLIATVLVGQRAKFTCVLLTGTTEASWAYDIKSGNTTMLGSFTKTQLNTAISDDNAGYLGTAQSWTAQQTFKDIKETVYTITDGAAFEIDPANGTIQTVTLGANRTPLATNFVDGQRVKLLIDDGTAYAITWTSVGVTWIGGDAPTLFTTGYSEIELYKIGGVIYGSFFKPATGVVRPKYTSVALDGSSNNTSGTEVLTSPATVAGDLLVMIIVGRSDGLSVPSTPTGWSVAKAHTTGGVETLHVFYRFAAATPPATYSVAFATERHYLSVIASFSNASFDVAGTVTTDVSMASYTSSGITATDKGLLLNIAVVTAVTNTAFVSPAEMTEVVNWNRSTAPALTVTMDIQDIEAGATGARSGTCSGANSGLSVLISLI